MNAKIGQGHRVVTLLSREQVDFLDRISKDALFSTGLKLSRVKIISAFVNALRKLGISGEGISSEEELEEKIIHKIQDSCSPRGESDNNQAGDLVNTEVYKQNPAKDAGSEEEKYGD